MSIERRNFTKFYLVVPLHHISRTASLQLVQMSSSMKKKVLHNRVNRDELKEQLSNSKEARTTLSFYKYYHIKNPSFFRDYLYYEWSDLGVLGRIYVAGEGVNGQMSVPSSNFEAFKKKMAEVLFLNGIRLNVAIEDDGKSFFKLAIKVRNKIVADGLNDDSFDVTDKGTHVNAEQFNTLTDDPNTILIDMRNHYESEVGYFEGAILPEEATFRELLPNAIDNYKDQKNKKVVMYCTGGIRCEKASAYFKHNGFEQVYQLDGGIIEYARQVEEQGLKNKFKGKNFVFDERLGERISNEIVSNCHQCGKPCDSHTNCANDACHLLFIQCEDCRKEHEGCCSNLCNEFIKKPEEEQKELRKTTEFNGTKFGKGRYKAHKGGLLG